jgi:hypothetical protein
MVLLKVQEDCHRGTKTYNHGSNASMIQEMYSIMAAGGKLGAGRSPLYSLISRRNIRESFMCRCAATTLCVK